MIFDQSIVHQESDSTKIISTMFSNIKANYNEQERKQKEKKEEEQMAVTTKSK